MTDIREPDDKPVIAPARPSMWRSVASQIAAALVVVAIFFGGLIAGQRMSRTSAASGEGGPRFALLLYGASTADDPASRAARGPEYSAWAERTHASAWVLRGEALASDGALLRRAGAEAPQEGDAAATAGPTGEELSGYFLIAAATLEDAVRLARECPHLRYGGTIVVRPIVPT